MLITSTTNGLLIIPDVFHTLPEERNNVGVGDAVIDLLAIAPCRDDVHLPQSTHVMGNRRLRDAYQLS
jgi:hypothetical protein